MTSLMERWHQEDMAEGAELNLLENVRTLRETLGLTVEQVMGALRVPEGDRERLRAKL